MNGLVGGETGGLVLGLSTSFFASSIISLTIFVLSISCMHGEMSSKRIKQKRIADFF